MKEDLERARAALLAGMGMNPVCACPLILDGDEPALDSPHRLALAATAALAAQASAIAALWQIRGGEVQTIRIDPARALSGLCGGLLQSISGHPVPISAGASSPVSNFYQTRDGRWIHPMGTYPGLRDGMLRLLDCANSEQAIAKAIGHWDAFELEDLIAERRLSGAVVRTREEWLAHPQGQAVAATPLVSIEKIGDCEPVTLPAAMRPLSEVRVIDFTHVIAGPTLSRTLAEQGAGVLRLVSPRFPDPFEFILDTGWGKRSAYMDLDIAGNPAKLDALIRGADVFVQSWSPGSLARRGLSPERLVQLSPGLVVASISAYGHNGPWAERKGFEQLSQAVSGVAAAESGADGRPRFVPTGLLADYLAAYLGAAGVVAALSRRAIEGGSYHVRVSLTGCAMWVQQLGVAPRNAGAKIPPVSLSERDTPFGRLCHLRPIVEFGTTPAYWELPPTTPGAHEPSW